VVIITHMSGYYEYICDPCSAGLILVFAYPLIGNYGVAPPAGAQGYAQAVVVRESCSHPSHHLTTSSLPAFLATQGIPLLSEVDTRAVTQHIRISGEVRGVVGAPDSQPPVSYPEAALPLTPTSWEEEPVAVKSDLPPLAVLDLGAAAAICQELKRLEYPLVVIPATQPVASHLPSECTALIISDGPGDPGVYRHLLPELQQLTTCLPVYAFGLGHLLLALALGGDCYRMPCGHRGSNYTVQTLPPVTLGDATLEPMHITSQNHGYAVLESSLLGTQLEVSHRELHDGTVEGMWHRSLPLWSLQYLPDCSRLTLDQTEECRAFWSYIRKVGS